MRSGNHLVDMLDDEQDKKITLECGCVGRCKCDDDDERGIDD